MRSLYFAWISLESMLLFCKQYVNNCSKWTPSRNVVEVAQRGLCL